MRLCETCGVGVELGGTVTKDCDGCLKAYVAEQKARKAAGFDPPSMSTQARRRAIAIGLCPG